MDLTRLLFEVIDFHSFSNLWYWIALAVTWSTASHWVLGVPFDIVVRARRSGESAMQDLEDIIRVNVNRMLLIEADAGFLLVALGFCALTMLGLLGFWYGIEFCQATFLIALPVSIVALLSLRMAKRIRAHATGGEELCRLLNRHRLVVQGIGVLSITVTAMWGMLQNFNLSPYY